MDRTRPSLLLRVRDKQDHRSWKEFVDLYGPIIMRYLARKNVPAGDALDLCQDILLIVATQISGDRFQYDPSRSFRAWLKTIASHRAYRYFDESRRRHASPGGTDHQKIVEQLPASRQADDDTIEEEWNKRRWEIAAKRVRVEVKPHTWRAFELRYVDNLPYGKIAEQLDMKIGTIQTSVSRVLARLRTAVEEIDE